MSQAARKCIGFGEFERKCDANAGPNPNWCPRCDGLRIAHIDRQFAKLSEAFAPKSHRTDEHELTNGDRT